MAAIQRNVANLKLGIAGLLSGTNVENVTNLYNALERGLRSVMQKAAIPEAMTNLNITFYDGVENYLSPVPIFGSTVKDARPLGHVRTPGDVAYRIGMEDFDRKKSWLRDGITVTFETQNGVNIMRAKSRFCIAKTVIDPMSQITDNSSGANSWTVGGLASGLVADMSVYYQNPASLRFNISGAGVSNLSKTLDNPIDMSIFTGVGLVFLELNLPALNLTNVTLQIGSDQNDYYSVTQTQGMLGLWTTNDFLDTPFDLSTASKTGSPNMAAVQYVNLVFTTSAGITNIRVGSLFASLPSQHKVLFSTTAVFQNTAGTVVTINNFITNDNDVILLSDAAYLLYEHEAARTVAFQNGGGAVLTEIDTVLNGSYTRTGKVITLGLYDKYRAENPSEEITQVGNYYLD